MVVHTSLIINIESNNHPSFIHAKPQIEPADIVVGSELTYLEKNVDPLINVLKRYMKPNGVFYEVLSDDRTVCQIFILQNSNL